MYMGFPVIVLLKGCCRRPFFIAGISVLSEWVFLCCFGSLGHLHSEQYNIEFYLHLSPLTKNKGMIGTYSHQVTMGVLGK